MTEAAQKPAKWQRRSDRRPDEILDAALAEFDRRGFDAARVEDIARGAGLSKAGVYLYFDTKEAILRGLIEREVAPVAHRMRALAEAGMDDPATALRMVVTALAMFVAEPKILAVPRIVISISSRYPEIVDHYRENVVQQALDAVRGLYRAGVEKGVFRPCDSDIAARAIIGPFMMHGFWTHLLRGDPGALTPEERARAHINLLFNGIMVERS